MKRIRNSFYKTLATLVCCAFGIMGLYIYSLYTSPHQQVVLSRATTWHVPKECKKLGIIGSTPHPTAYVQKYPDIYIDTIQLSDFLDMKELKDSYIKTIQLCKEEQIDHLIIAYLPVYYSKIKESLGKATALKISLFFDAVAPQICNLLYEVRAEMKSNLRITLLIPSYDKLHQIPTSVVSPEQYAQFLVKQFPKLVWDNTDLETIVIINTTNTGDDNQTNAIERYLEYEYLLNKPVLFKQAFIDKARFHTYKENL